MGRLTELLFEQEGAPTLIVIPDINKTTEAGNLLRLLLVFDPVYTPLELNGTTIINKLLPIISKNTKKDVKTVFARLKTEFNKITIKTKKGKVSRAIYFDSVLRLLLPFLNSKSFKLTNLKTIYKSDDSIDIQRVTTAKIGKALLNNPEIELTPIDKQFIKSIASYNTENIEPEKNTEENIDEVDSELSGKTDDELLSIISNVEKVMNNVKSMNIDKTEELSVKLKTNEDPNIYKVELSNKDAEVTPIINNILIETFNKIKSEYDQETANFISQLSRDIFVYLDTATNGYLNFFKKYISLNVEKTPNGLRFTTLIGSDNKDMSNGNYLKYDRFKVSQVFNIDTDGKSNVYLEEIQMPSSYQHSGIFKSVFKNMLDIYKAQGIEKVTLEANVDVGGYAWFRFGFTPTSVEEITHIANWMKSESVRFSLIAQTDKESLIKHIEKNSSDTTTDKTIIMPEVLNLISFIRDNEYKVVAPVLQELINKCAEEFEKFFNDKKKFKKLNEYISTRLFMPKMINGCDKPITLSCKTILTLYVMKDITEPNEVKVVNVPTTGYLAWHGELMMDNLEDTYAYLNLK